METFDSIDAEILAERELLFNQRQGPRVGDFLKTPEGFLRFTHDWGDSIQTTDRPSHPCHGDASFYLSDGYASFSGSLDPSIDKDSLSDTGKTREGSFWFFHHNQPGAGRGVHFKIRCRVFKKIDRFACFVLYGVFRTIRRSVQDQREAELLDRWHARNKLIQAAVMDLDSPDPLQRILAETFIDSLLP